MIFKYHEVSLSTILQKKIDVAILTSQMGKYAKNNKQLRIALKKCKYGPLLVTSLILGFLT